MTHYQIHFDPNKFELGWALPHFDRSKFNQIRIVTTPTSNKELCTSFWPTKQRRLKSSLKLGYVKLVKVYTFIIVFLFGSKRQDPIWDWRGQIAQQQLLMPKGLKQWQQLLDIYHHLSPKHFCPKINMCNNTSNFSIFFYSQ